MSDSIKLTHSQAVNRLKDIDDELERLQNKDVLTPEDETSFVELTREFDELDEYRKKLERDTERARVKAVRDSLRNGLVERPAGANGDGYDRDAILEPDSVEEHRFRNPWDLSEVRTYGRPAGEVDTELRSRALSAIEKMPGCNDKIRSAATKILEEVVDHPSKLARQILLTSSPAYLRAWSKTARGNAHAMSPEETQAMGAVQEFRAMSLTDAAGGFLVPFQLDPTVIITSNGSLNQIRQAARQVVATGDRWNGVSSAAVSWSWDAEASEVSDDSTVFAQPVVDVHTARGFVPISLEALADEQNVTAEVARLLAEGKDDLEAVAFTTGTGTGQPFGIVTALAGGGSVVAPTTAETFALADVYKVQGALPAKYRSRASWLANNIWYNAIRQFDTSGGGGFWTNLNDGRPPQLIGRPALEAEAMDADLPNAAVTAANHGLIFGDFSNYVIADRVGMTVEFIPHLFHTANNRPSGQRGWFAYYRTGADSVNDGGFRMLSIPTAV